MAKAMVAATRESHAFFVISVLHLILTVAVALTLSLFLALLGDTEDPYYTFGNHL